MSTAPPPRRRPSRPLAGRRPVPPVLRDWRAYVGFAAIVVAVVLAVTALGGGGGEDDRPPVGDAARLVPADALAYVHVSTDEDRGAVRRALRLLDRFPAEATLRRQLTGLLGVGGDGVTGEAPLDVGRDVAPWLGDEAALAITRGRGATAGSLMLLAVAEDDLGDARAFLARGAGTPARSTYRGVSLTRYRNGTVTAYVEGFLAIGQQRSVRAAVDLAAAGAGGDDAPARSLAGDAVYRRAIAGAPDGRVIDAYATVDGVRRLLAPQPGVLGLVGALLDQRGLRGTALALTAEDERARVRVHAVLDPRERTAPPRFEPTLTESVPADALAYAGFAGIERAAPALLGLTGLTGLGDTNALLAQVGRVLREGGVDVARDVLPLFGQEVAVVAVPAEDAPAIALLARTQDPERTRAALTRLEPAIARLFTPEGGSAPAWVDARAGSTPMRRLAPTEGIELDYAVVGDTVAVATSGDAIAAVAEPEETIADDPAYRATVPDSTGDLTSVVFFDFGQLLRSLEEMGLTSGLGGDGVVDDLERVRAVGLTSTSEEDQSTAELTLEIS